ncbi:hypothetical protein NE237_027122 [Protea cynaroides]|uniref:Uncharacterized protein n=1 Tax=Protea cynaroides TaxID=273540 RepID=A0A9Q0GPW3_9MAGN|nr:hypothetical protein NE237_027122 [Protea cynaroides]
MAVRFKFRSSVDFDSIDIAGRPSISVRDLRSKILQQKNLKICQDFDIVISDAETGDEYDDEDFLVPSGSSVVIKRVPAGRSVLSALPCINSVENWVAKPTNFVGNAGSLPSMKVDVNNFDDFGIDLYPATEAALLDSDLDVDEMNYISSEKADNAFQRSSEPSTARCQNTVPSDINEAILKGVTRSGIEGSQINLRHKMEETKKLDEAVKANFPALPNADLPVELRCSLCNTIFRDAVMIRCCQHSFCEKCIRLALIEKARCPKCSSTRCGVEDLLPNVSLRQAIDHFLESQMLLSGSDNILPQYAPDGESGIQAKELSCAISICQREPVLPHSPSTTGKGSNIVMAESASESVIRSNASAAGTNSRLINLGATKSVKSFPLHQVKQVNGDGVPGCAVNFECGRESMKSVDFQGENQPFKLRQTLREKGAASTTIKKEKGFWVNQTDGIGSFMATSRHRKVDRTCYMCGSPDHFIRNCPAASSPHPLLQTGDAVYPGSMPTYGQSYWQGSSLPHIRPFANIYGNAGLIPFDPTMVPVTPFSISSYMPSMYSGMAVPCGPMRMVGLVPPVISGAECALSRSEFMELQDSEQRQKHKHKQRDRLHDGDDLDGHYMYNHPERSLDCKQRLDKEHDGNFSEDTLTQRSQQKRVCDKCPDEDIHVPVRRDYKGHRSSGKDHKPHKSDRSSSEIEDSSDSSNWHRKKTHKHHKRSSKQHTERRGECGGNAGHRSHYESQKEITRQRIICDAKICKHKNHSRSESCLEPSSSGDRRRQRREKECSHSSRHSNRKLNSSEDLLNHDRWEMVESLDEDYREDSHHHHKRKRIH